MPYKEVNIRFMTLYGIITGPLSADYTRYLAHLKKCFVLECLVIIYNHTIKAEYNLQFNGTLSEVLLSNGAKMSVVYGNCCSG